MKFLILLLTSLNILTCSQTAFAKSPKPLEKNARTSLSQLYLDQEKKDPPSKQDESEKKDSDLEAESAKESEPTPEEIARLEKLALADKLYLAGDKAAAAKLYREAKEVWEIEKKPATGKKYYPSSDV